MLCQKVMLTKVKDNFSPSSWNHNNSITYESKSVIWISSDQKGQL